MSVIENQVSTHAQDRRSVFSRFWSWVANPHPEVTEIGDRRRAQLLAGLSLVLVLPLLFGVVLRFITNDPSEWFTIETFEFLGLVIFALLAYILSRTSHFQWGSIALVTAFSVTAVVNSLTNNTVEGAFFFLIPAFVIGSALLRLGGIATLVTINVAIIFLMPVVVPSVEQAFSNSGIVLTAGLLLILVVAVRNLIERERLAEVESVNQELRSLQSSLEQRVAEATRNLELAAEVGQRLSLVRETNLMLTDAVELIRERFDLYYTQVYLTDPTGRALVLRAGTGDAGQTLLRRGHRLPVDMGSLNGIAATERRAVIVEDTETSSLHRSNPLLPDTRSEMVVPLLVGERVVGVLDMQSAQPGALSGQNLPAFEALAGQLAISIANAGLFEEVERSRSTVEEQARRLTREGWQDFMDAIERSERIAYTFDRETVAPFDAPLLGAMDESTLVTPIQVSGEQVGTFQFERETGWTTEDQTVVNTVAQQVAQQIENLRLLAQSEQYQAEAQEALKRLTREGWEQYQENLENTQVGFVFRNFEVQPLDEADTEPQMAVTVPITIRDETIGQLEVLDTETLSEEDAELVAYINEQLSAQLENLRLSAQTQQALGTTERQAARLTSLNKLSEQLAASQSFEDIFKAAGERLTEIVEADRVSMTRLHEGGEFLEVFALQGLEGAIPTGTQLPVAQTAVGKAIQQRRPVNIANLEKDKHLESEPLMKQGLRSTLAVPLLGSQFPFGTINFGSTKTGAFNERDVELVVQAAAQIAAVLENRGLLEQTQLALAQTEILYGGSEKVIQASNMSEVLNALVESTALKDLDRASLNIFDHPWDSKTPPEGMTMVASWIGSGEEGTVPTGTYYQVSEYPAARFLSNNQPTFISNLAEDPRFDEQSRQYFTEVLKVKGVIGLPLIIGGRSIGGIVALSNSVLEIEEGEIRQMASLSDQAATVIQSMRLFEQTQKRAAELATVAELGTTISTILEEQQLLETVVQLTLERFDLYHCHIFTMSENLQTLQVAACGWEENSPHAGTHEETRINLDQEQSLVAQAARNSNAVIVNDVRDDPNWLPNELLPDTRAEMAVPMVAGNQVLGVLDVQAKEVDRFTEEDISIMTTLASQVAVAVQNARTYAQTQQQAEHEATINLISQRIQSTTSVENALQVAIRELGRALGAKRTNVQLGLPSEKKLGK